VLSFNRNQIAKLDKLAVESGLEIIQMMELAGFHIMEVCRALRLNKALKVVAVCGKGNKGGDGLCALRHLVNYGFKGVVLLAEKNLKPDPFQQLKLLRKMGVTILDFESQAEESKKAIERADIIIDALLGYNIHGEPRGTYKDLIYVINQAKAKVISYDLPSGLNPTTGKGNESYVKAFATLTLAIPKSGLFSSLGKRLSGRVFVGDLGIPAQIYDKIQIGSRPDFKGKLLTIK